MDFKLKKEVLKNLEMLLKLKHKEKAKNAIESINKRVRKQKFASPDDKIECMIKLVCMYIDNPDVMPIQYLN